MAIGFRSVVLLFLGVFAISAWSIPKTTIESISGFDVHFVDIGVGDSMAVCFYTPYGTFHDQFQKMGRAHLLEHIMFTGTKLFPGYHTFDDMMKPAGAKPNAHTAYGNTYYYASGPLKQRHLLIQGLLSMLGGLEWNPSVYENEKGVVINEVAEEDNRKEAYAIHNMSLAELLPPSHPWARPLYGDLDSLRGLSISDLKEFYHRAYAPGVVSIAVIGNFSEPAVLQDVRAQVVQILDEKKIQEDRAGLGAPEKPTLRLDVPSLFSTSSNPAESQIRLHIETESMNQGLILLEIPERDAFALDLLVEYLSLAAPGTLSHHLQTELGWVSQVSMFPVHFKNRAHLYFNYDLTEAGLSHRTEIHEMFFRALRSLAVHGPDPTILQMLKDQTALQIERASRSVDEYLIIYESMLRESASTEKMLTGLQSVFVQDIQRLAQLFRPDHALYVETGRGVPNMTMDSRFHRSYILQDNRAELSRYLQASTSSANEFQPRLRPVELGLLSTSVENESKFEQTHNLPWQTDRWVLDFRQDLPDLAAMIRLSLNAPNIRSLVAVDLVLLAFLQKYEGEITDLSLKYQVEFQAERVWNFLKFKTMVEDRYAALALQWLLEQMKSFTPSAQELSRAKESYVTDQRQAYSSSFTGPLGLDLARALIDPLHLTNIAAVETAAGLTEADVHALWSAAIAKTDKQYVMVGAFATPDFQNIYHATHALSPSPLDQDTRASIADRSQWKNQSQQLREPFPAARAADVFAPVRMYRGPNLQNMAESAAFLAMNEAVTARIVSHNRGDQSLGYVHYSSARSLDHRHHFLALIGQADGTEKLAMTIDGWEHVLKELRDGSLSDQKILDGIHSLQNQLSTQLNSAEEWVEDYSDNQTFRGDGRARQSLLAAAQKLTVADVRAVAHQFVTAPDVPATQVIFGDCPALLK